MSGSAIAREELRSGLTRVLSDVPVRSGALELGATYTSLDGAQVYAEAVLRPAKNLGIFAGATLSPRAQLAAEVGARYTFNW